MDPKVETVAADQLEFQLFPHVRKERNALPEHHGIDEEPEAVDQAEFQKRVRGGGTSEKEDFRSGFLLDGGDLFGEVVAEEEGVAESLFAEGLGQHDLADSLVPTGVVDFVLAGVGLVGGGGPVALHHLIGDAAVEGAVSLADALVDVAEKFWVEGDPVHLSIGAGDEAVEGEVVEGDDFSHGSKEW